MINEFKHAPFLSKHTIKADVEWFLKSHSNFMNPQTSVNNINEFERKTSKHKKSDFKVIPCEKVDRINASIDQILNSIGYSKQIPNKFRDKNRHTVSSDRDCNIKDRLFINDCVAQKDITDNTTLNLRGERVCSIMSSDGLRNQNRVPKTRNIFSPK